MNNVYLALGSNIEPELYIPLALKRLRDDFPVLAVSSAYQSPAVGSDNPEFINAVVLIQTNHDPDTLKHQYIRPLEAELGRIRTDDKNAPRTIDIDILLYDDVLYEEELWERVHLAVPLAEIYPEYSNPDSKSMINEIAEQLRQSHKIKVIKGLIETNQ